jgi:mercuric ion transport protein
MNESQAPSSGGQRPATGAGAVFLTASGFVAAFAVASCCALPIILSGLGIGTAWLFGFAALAAPHRTLLLGIGAVALGGAAVAMWRQRSAVCEPGAWCARPAVRLTTGIGLILGILLLVAGYEYS